VINTVNVDVAELLIAFVPTILDDTLRLRDHAQHAGEYGRWQLIVHLEVEEFDPKRCLVIALAILHPEAVLLFALLVRRDCLYENSVFITAENANAADHVEHFDALQVVHQRDADAPEAELHFHVRLLHFERLVGHKRDAGIIGELENGKYIRYVIGMENGRRKYQQNALSPVQEGDTKVVAISLGRKVGEVTVVHQFIGAHVIPGFPLKTRLLLA
jgi:hypothetical protein